MNRQTEQIRTYHERTKHRLDAYARGPEFLDWDRQPNPFRRFSGVEQIPLPFLSLTDTSTDEPNQIGFNSSDKRTSLSLKQVAALLEYALGLSAWKQFGPDRWALRCNPSSGNLHPTEAYIAVNGVEGLHDGVYHYAPCDHVLELRATVEANTSPQCLLGLSSIVWREAWKYGERAFRYVQLDIGHALGAIKYAAKALGLQVQLLDGLDTEIASLFGLDRDHDFEDADSEHPDLLLRVYSETPSHPAYLPNALEWFGQANALGGFPRPHWEIIDQVAAATHYSLRNDHALKPPTKVEKANPELLSLIKQRRSAQAFRSKESTIPRETFYQVLNKLLPNEFSCPWQVWELPTRIHLVLFVHRVEGLPAGLYALPRHIEAKLALKEVMNSDFIWQTPEACPDQLPLFLLLEADTRKAAWTLSCHQDIAANSAFSLGMISEFDACLADTPHAYRHLYWEAGLLGQVLYLEAEKVGMRGTGIGCFFDDSVHELLGLQGTQFQSVYHFTLGSPVIDERLETLPAYAHLAEERNTL